MSNATSLSRLQSILEFPFKQPEGWQKLAIGAGLTLLSFVVPLLPGLFVTGYQAEVARRALRTGELALPDWVDWGRLLLDGLKVTGVFFVYLFPALLAFFAGYGGLLGSSMAMGLLDEATSADSLTLMPLFMLGTFGGMALFGVGMLLALAGGVVLPAAIMHMLARGDFAAAFRVREWGALWRANLSAYLLGFVLVLGLSFVFSFAIQLLQLTLVLCCLVPFVMAGYSMYMGTVSSALFGLIYREAAGPAPVAGREPGTPAPLPAA